MNVAEGNGQGLKADPNGCFRPGTRRRGEEGKRDQCVAEQGEGVRISHPFSLAEGSPKMYQVNTAFQRPDKGLIDKVSTQHVGVCGFSAGPRQVMHPDIKPLDPAWRVCGPAFTVRPEFWDDRLMGELAPKYAKPGDVLVIDAGGHTEVAAWGMSMTISSAKAGIAGIVIDGSTTNSALLARERVQIPIFSRGVSAAVKGSEGPGSLNVPVICGGVIVYPGDIILGDSDGVVVLRPDEAKRIVAESEAHDDRSRSDKDKDIPYYVRKNSEEKLRAMDRIEWN